MSRPEITIHKRNRYGTAQEAIRALQKAEKWIPGKMRVIPIKTQFNFPISIQSAKGNYQEPEPTYESEMIKNRKSRW